MDKSTAILNMAKGLVSAIDSGAPVTDSAYASLPRFADMVRPIDPDLAARLIFHAR